MVSRRVASAGVAALGLVAAAGVTTCAILAPRPASRGRKACWEEFCRFRYADGGLAAPDAPSGSLTAFTRARELGFGARLDVRLTLDGALVVARDSSLVHSCGHDGTVEQMTLSELGELRLMGTDEPIPTLGEVLRLFELAGPAGSSELPEAAPVVVELRPHAGNVELLARKTAACLDAYDVRPCVSSEDPRALAWLRRHRPDVIRGQVVRNFVADGDTRISPLVRFARTGLLGNSVARPDFVACRFSDRSLPSVRLVCGVLGCRLVTWGVHDEQDLLDSEAAGSPAFFSGFVPDAASTMGSEP